MSPKLSLALAPLLVGCATVADTSQAPLSGSYLSAKSPDAAERCLSERLAFLVGGPLVTRIEGGTRIAFTSSLYTYLVVTIRPEGSSTRIDVNHRQTYPKAVRRAVEGCV